MTRMHRGRWPVVGKDVFVDASAQVIGEVELGAQSSVWMNAVLRGDVHAIRIGARSNVQDGAVLHGMKGVYGVEVGEGCTIGHNATVHGCVLEDDVLVGMGAVVLNGARIGAGSIVAAGSLVTERMVVPARSLVVGVPAKVKRELTEAEVEGNRMYAARYVESAREYMEEGN